MNAQEIINELNAGKTVAILSDDAFEFMREVERHGILCEGISMNFRGGQCVMLIEGARDSARLKELAANALRTYVKPV